MKRFVLVLLVIIVASAFSGEKTLKGTWEYKGGIYNGKKELAPADYTMQRQYDKTHFNAFALEKGYKPEKYEAGDYILKGDTCIETETFSSQPSKLKGIPVHYRYHIRHDSLIFNGILPSGMVVEEYWKRVK
jgi:hypothetical protein